MSVILTVLMVAGVAVVMGFVGMMINSIVTTHHENLREETHSFRGGRNRANSRECVITHYSDHSQ